MAGGRYDDILKACGELCDLEKPIMPGTFLGHVKAKVRLVDYFWYWIYNLVGRVCIFSNFCAYPGCTIFGNPIFVYCI